MERTDQITSITRLLEFLEGNTKEDALRMISECEDYVMGRDDLFPHENKLQDVKNVKER